MAKICAQLSSDRLIVATGETLAIISSGGRKPFLLTIPDVNAKSVAENLDKSATGEGDAKDGSGQIDGCHILCLRGCKCGRHVAMSNSRKHLVVIETPQQDDDVNESTCRIVFSVILQRNSLCVTFVDDCSRVLAADKSGDVVAYDLISGKDRILLFGHLAIILDMVISEGDKYVITCDRDEKIKTTSYPNTYNIQSFCLGHSEYVIGIGITSQNKDVLYSASGDGTIRLWKYKDGKSMDVINCKDYLPAEIVSMCAEMQSAFQRGPTRSDGEQSTGHLETTTKTTKSRSLSPQDLLWPIKKVTISERDVIAVIFYRLPLISLFRVTGGDLNDTLSCRHLQNLILKLEPWDVCFDNDGNLISLCGDEKTTIATGYAFKDETFLPLNAHSKAASLVENIANVWPLLNVSSDVPSVVPTLFKQWFDNVTDYYEKKEKRSNLHTAITHSHKKKRLKI